MTYHYEPKSYWESRLNKQFSLRGVGHVGFSERYNYWLYRRKQRCIDTVFRDVSLVGKEVLDVGCGTGFFVNWYLRRGARVSGIDITDVSVERLRTTYPGEFHRQDISDPAYSAPDRKFDIVNVWDVFYHIVNDDAFERALANIRNSLKHGGLFLFSDFLGQPADIRIADHVKGRCLRTYEHHLKSNDFGLVKTVPLYRFLNRPCLGRADNHLGGLYLFLDGFTREIPSHNLSLSVWRYDAMEHAGHVAGVGT